MARPFWNTLEDKGDAPALITQEGEAVSYRRLSEHAEVWRKTYDDLWPGDATPQLLIALTIVPDLQVIAAYLGALRGGHSVMLGDCDLQDPDSNIVSTYRPNITVGRHNGSCRAIVASEAPIALHDDLRVLLSTSGTTGAPKLVRLSVGNIQSNADAIAEYLGVTPDERAIMSLPLYYSYGLSVLHTHLNAGASFVMTSDSITSPEFWALFKAQNASSLAFVPHQFELLEAVSFAKMDLPSLRYITQAGGKLAQQKILDFAKLGSEKGWSLFVMYGQTEASPRMAYIPPDDLVAHSDTIGQAIPGGKLWVCDDDGAPVTSPKVAGELCYEGPNVMMGYAEAPSDLDAELEPALLRTGDIAVQTDHGFFKIVGRKKRFVKLYGLRLSLDQMEQDLAAQNLPGFCMNVNDRLVILHKESVSGPDVQNFLADRYTLPTDAILPQMLKDTPLMSSGKVDYKALQATAKTAADHDALAANSAQTGAKSLRETIRRATRSTQITDTDSFNSLGGDSLAYIQVTLALEEALGLIPENWEQTPISDLEKLTPVGRGRSSIGTDVLVRLIAVSLIVINHAGLGMIKAGGGTWVLLIIIGHSFARFSRGSIAKGAQFQTALKLLYPILPLYYLILFAADAAGRTVIPSMYTLTNNLGNEFSGFLVSPNWFVSLYVQVIIGLVVVLSVPSVTRTMTKDPWRLGLFGLGLTLAGSIAFQLYANSMISADTPREEMSYIYRSPLTCLPFVAVGWMIACVDSDRRRWITVLAVIAVAAQFRGPEPYYSFVVGIGGLLLMARFTIAMPRILSVILRVAAGTTLFVYMLHAVPIQVLVYETGLNKTLGLWPTALLATLLAFVVAYLAKLAFDVFDRTFLALRSAVTRRRNG
jgi:acyl carrier protein